METDKHQVNATPPDSNPVLFNLHESRLTVIEFEDQPWFIAKEVGASLGYAEEGTSLVRMLNREWKEEFIDGVDILQVTNGKLAAIKAALRTQNTKNARPNPIDARAPSVTLLSLTGVQLAAMKREGPEGVSFRKLLRFTIIPEWQKARSLPTQQPLLPDKKKHATQTTLPALAEPVTITSVWERHTPEEDLAYKWRMGEIEAPNQVSLRRGRILGWIRAGQLSRQDAVNLLEKLGRRKAPRVEGGLVPGRVLLAQAGWLVAQLSPLELVDVEQGMLDLLRLNTRSEPDRAILLGIIMGELQQVPDRELPGALVMVRRWALGECKPL